MPRPLLALLLAPLPSLALVPAAAPGAPQSDAAPAAVAPREWLVLPPVDERGRRPFRPDAVLARYVLDPASPPPRAGETVEGESGEAAWEARAMDGEGRLGGRIGYAYAAVPSAAERVVLARLAGASTLLVGGVPYAGDVYGYGGEGVPIRLAAGTNHVLVTGVREAFSPSFSVPEGPLVVGEWDATIPDLVAGEGGPGPLVLDIGLLVQNASLARLADLRIEAEGAAIELDPAPALRRLAPLQVRKLPVRLRLDPARIPPGPGEIEVPGGIRAGGRTARAPASC
ncbi:MAG: hypothetical protein AB1726_03365 [Planctomycetota bacterium]